MNPDEEISSSFSTPILIEQASKADHAFVMESALLTGEACMERKGMVQYTLEFQGIAAHAGYVYETRNASAILEMAHWIPALSALGDREKRTSANVGMVSGARPSMWCPTGPSWRWNSGCGRNQSAGALRRPWRKCFAGLTSIRFRRARGWRFCEGARHRRL